MIIYIIKEIINICIIHKFYIKFKVKINIQDDQWIKKLIELYK